MKKTKSIDYIGAVLGLKMVIDKQSYSKASLELGISQPALSKRINKLESIYAASIIIKRNSRVSLTKIGRILYLEACKFEKIHGKTIEDINRLKQMQSKNLIGITIDERHSLPRKKRNEGFEYIYFPSEEKMKESFNAGNIDGMIISEDRYQQYAKYKPQKYKKVELELYTKMEKNISNVEDLINFDLLVHHDKLTIKSIEKFLDDTKLNKYTYVDNFDIVYAKMLLDENVACISTNLHFVPSEYRSLIKKQKIFMPKLSLYLVVNNR